MVAIKFLWFMASSVLLYKTNRPQVLWVNDVIFQKRVRVFYRVSKQEKHLKPRGRRPSGVIVFERLET